MKKKIRDPKQTQCIRIKLGAGGTTMHKKLERIRSERGTGAAQKSSRIYTGSSQKKEKELMKSMRVWFSVRLTGLLQNIGVPGA